MRGAVRPCARCDWCRRARAADHVTRLLVECLGHVRACLVTLTYATPNLPPGRSLSRADARAFLKRFRRAVEWHGGPRGLRIFLVGEYGTLSRRPHYHLILWGADHTTVWNGRSVHQLVEQCWGMGRVDVGTYWSDKAAAYVSGYVTKGCNLRGKVFPDGRIHEFSIFPKPALGSAGLSRAVDLLVGDDDPLAVIEATGDLPGRLDLGGSQRLARGKLLDMLREHVGVPRHFVPALKERKQLLALGVDVSVDASRRRHAELRLRDLLWGSFSDD